MFDKPLLIATFLMALAVWVAFKIIQPQAPLDAGETVVVVAVCYGAVLGGQRLWQLLKKKG